MPNRRVFDHTGNFIPVEVDGVTVASVNPNNPTQAYFNNFHPVLAGKSEAEKGAIAAQLYETAIRNAGGGGEQVVYKTPRPDVGGDNYPKRLSSLFWPLPGNEGLRIQKISPFRDIITDFPLEDSLGLSRAPVLMRKTASESGGAIVSPALDLTPDIGMVDPEVAYAEVVMVLIEVMQPALTSAGQVSGQLVIDWADLLYNANNGDVRYEANSDPTVVVGQGPPVTVAVSVATTIEAISEPRWSRQSCVFTCPADGTYRSMVALLGVYSEELGACVPGRALVRARPSGADESLPPSLPIKVSFNGLGSNTNFQAAATAIVPGTLQFNEVIACLKDDYGMGASELQAAGLGAPGGGPAWKGTPHIPTVSQAMRAVVANTQGKVAARVPRIGR